MPTFRFMKSVHIFPLFQCIIDIHIREYMNFAMWHIPSKDTDKIKLCQTHNSVRKNVMLGLSIPFPLSCIFFKTGGRINCWRHPKKNSLNKQVPVYHLNADFDYRKMQDFSRLDPDCLHTTLTTPLTMPKQVISQIYHCLIWSHRCTSTCVHSLLSLALRWLRVCEQWQRHSPTQWMVHQPLASSLVPCFQ